MSAAVIKVHEVSMREGNLFLGLVTTIALLFAAPVAATEIDNISHSSRIEEIQGMIQRSRERQGSIQTQEVKEPIAPASSQTAELETGISPISPITAPNSTSTAGPVHTPKSAQSTTPVPAKSTFHNQSAQSTTSATTPAPSKTTAQSRVVPQRAQQVAVRHANRHRHQSASDEPPATKQEPSREVQVSHKPFMLFAADLAWNRVDESSDKSIRNPYSLGARLENGVITPLAAIRVYAPDKVPEGLAILAGEKEYT